jgi:hypothetical protein
MSMVNTSSGLDEPGDVKLPQKGQPLHRLGIVRRLQAISRRTVARRLNVDVTEVRRQEEESCDLPLSTLYLWQQALEVPLSELLVESSDALSLPLMQRAQLVRLMKTGLAILEQANDDGVRLMAQTLVDQLVEIMPELRGVSAWHAVGKRRRLDELGNAANRALSDEVFLDLTD